MNTVLGEIARTRPAKEKRKDLRIRWRACSWILDTHLRTPIRCIERKEGRLFG